MKPLQALQATLAAEHAAVYVYGVLGGRLSASQDPRTATLFQAAYTVHRERRDHLRDRISALGATPVGVQPGYQVPAVTRDADRLRAVALTTEQRCEAVYAQQVAATVGQDRRWATQALVDASVRSLAFGGRPQPYPGLPGLP